MNSTLFDNCSCLSPAGEFMFYCSKRKAQFYLKRNLASVVSENPLVFQLTFMPKGKGNPHEKGKRKKNICVCCGVEKDLTRHHIVPLQYRKLFSLENKDHRHNDIVALCQSCHHAYEKTANEIRLRLEKDFEDIVNKNALISQKKKAISALKRELPLERREFFLRKEEELKDLPENPIDIDTLVIQKYGEKTLSRIWRNHFSEWLYKQRTK